MAKKAAPAAGFSFRRESQIDVGLWQGGECRIKDIGFCEYDYGGTMKRDLPIVLLVVFQHAEGVYEQPYSMGDGWSLPDTKDDLTPTIVPRKGQTGFPKSSNAAHFVNSLEEAGYDLGDWDGEEGVKVMVGQGLVVKREAQPDRTIRKENQRRGRDEEQKNEKTFLLVRELLDEAPVFDEKKASAKPKAKAQAPDEDEPVRKTTKKATAKAQDEDEDEAPVSKSTKGGKANGAAKDDDYDDEAHEVLIDVLDRNDGQLELDAIEEKVFTHLRKHPHKKEIAALAADPDFIGSLDDVTFNKKKGIVALAG